MIILKTNRELELTFERLIKAMDVPVEWTKNFVVVGDYLILQGRVRSLFFNFENKKVLTNLIDIPIKKENVVEVGENDKLQNVLNLVLYAFGKWGSIKGIRVEKDYARLNQLFTSVLRELAVEPEYNRENFRFYKEKIRVAYEDVIQLAIEAAEKKEEPEEAKAEEEAGGLWHKLIWKKRRASFMKTKTTFAERQKERLGNNFYMVGYHCAKCGDHLHMAVFPEGKEFKIETDEGGVLLARAYTCPKCHAFYTPRPEKLLAEGDIYAMEFGNDVRAYDDYMELLGEDGDRISNYNFNEFVSSKQKKETKQQKPESVEEICEKINELSSREIERLQDKIEEGFYRGNSAAKLEEALEAEENRRREERRFGKTKQSPMSAKHTSGSVHPVSALERAAKQKQSKEEKEIKTEAAGKQAEENQTAENKVIPKENDNAEKTTKEKNTEKEKAAAEKREAAPPTEVERASAKRRYEAKFGVLDRLSDIQLKDLRKQLENETKLFPEEREAFLTKIKEHEKTGLLKQARELARNAAGQNYAGIGRILDKIKETDIPQAEKEELIASLQEKRKSQAEAEVRRLTEKIPLNLDRSGYQAFTEKLKSYEGVDLSPYEEKLKECRMQAEKKEITNLLKHSKADTREALHALTERLKGQDFAEEVVSPYLEKIKDKIMDMDSKEIAEICADSATMSEEELHKAYETIENGAFLPELKTNALEMLKKRLKRIKTDESELLVSRLKESMDGKLKENNRHHFYPAKKVFHQEKNEKDEEQDKDMTIINAALVSYGSECGEFEYPILIADTSKNESGKDGMILTPEHIFFRTTFGAYSIPIVSIRGIRTSTGLIGGGLFAELSNGKKVKLPYAVNRQELLTWGKILKEFIAYLQEKPDSRQLPYLAKEKHETICCFRCGYMYKGGNVCPKCGYKRNQ